jgi:GNAT superfamily N-acetyltransferase
VLIRAAVRQDRSWLAEVLRSRWGGTSIVVSGKLVDALSLAALIAEDEGRRCGVATYECRGPECEIITLDALEQYCGIGTALVDAVAEIARERGAARLLVVTTNDNLDALRFYQRRSFAIVGVRVDAVTQSRRIKPAIPLIGRHGIPIRDAIELVRML